MISPKHYINNFFMRFSYTTKTNFIFVIGNLPLILLVMMTYKFIYNPMQQIHTQLEGMAYINQISELLDNVANSAEYTPYNSQESIEELLQVIRQKLERRYLKRENKNAFDLLKIDLTVFQYTLNRIQQYSSKTPQETPYQTLLEELTSSYHDVVADIVYICDLMTVQPAILRGLVYILSQDFPRVQRDTFRMTNSSHSELSKEVQYEIFANELSELEQNTLEILTSLSRYYPQIVMNHAQKKLSEQYLILSERIYLGEEYPQFKLMLSDQPAFHAVVLQSLQMSNSIRQDLWNILASILNMQLSSWQHIFWACVFTFVVGELGVLMIFFAHLLRHPLCEIAKGAKMLEKGDLSMRMPIKTHDEVAELTLAFNALADYYEKILKTATGIIKKIFQASSKISDLAKTIESNMSIQEQMINQMAQHSKIIQDEVKEHARVIDGVNKEATGTYVIVQQGHQHLHGMESVMHEMLNAVQNVVTTLSSLQEKITDINKVISAIVKIADQSNLLSLNTAIRAKKSGTEGRGFVVIADKIREMADQIAMATLDFEDSVENIIGDVKETVADVDDLSKHILKQFEETAVISDHLKQLIESTQQQMKDFEKINEGMQCYTKQEEAINLAINDLETNIQVTAFSVHKLFLEIEYLHDASQNLHEKTQQFIFSP